VGSSPASGSRLPQLVVVHDEGMSERTDATQDRPDEDDVELAREDRDELGGSGGDDADEPQPWAKTSSGDGD
jgi:hypothetical protein